VAGAELPVPQDEKTHISVEAEWVEVEAIRRLYDAPIKVTLTGLNLKKMLSDLCERHGEAEIIRLIEATR
jgi:hypothetical protein